MIDKIRRLIEMLEEDMPQYGNVPVPESEEEAFNLFRMFSNVRIPAKKMPEEFYALEKEVLQNVTEAKGVTDAESIPCSGLDERLRLWQGDITTLKADVIVNAANSQMLGCFQPMHSCIDNMIHTMAGVELREKCAEIMQGRELQTGDAVLTPAYNLPSDKIVHTVGPIISMSPSEDQKKQLAMCYRNSLELASMNECRSIAFCCISTGVFHFPPALAADIAVSTVRTWLNANPESSVKNVIFNVFRIDDLRLYQNLLFPSQGKQA